MIDDLFVNKILEKFREVGVSDAQSYRLGETSFEVSYHGFQRQDNFTKAISHLVSENLNNEFRIYVSDLVNGGLRLPKPQWEWNDLDQNGFIPTTNNKRYLARFMSWQNCFYLIDFKQKRAFFWVKNYLEMPEWERSFPFRDIFHCFFNSFDDFVVVHAAAVGNSSGGILMPGKGGSGKSTAALSCLNSELFYAGDDLVLVDFKRQIIYSLYNVAKLEVNQIALFPALLPLIYNADVLPQEKAQVFVNDFYPDKIICKMPFLGIVLPKYKGSENTTYKESNSAKALLALAPSSIGLLKTDVSYLNKIARMLKGKKVFDLETGSKLNQISESIENIIGLLND